jgi:hypothetical protein
MRARIARAVAWVGAAVMIGHMAACTGTQLRGRAITGSAGVVAVVPNDGAHDDRPGVEGVQVTVRAAGAGGAVIGTAVSKADGRFSFSTSTQRARGQVEVVAEREGYPRQRGSVVFPGQGHLLLVILPERGGDEVGAGSGGGQ